MSETGAPPPAIRLELAWDGDQRFRGSAGGAQHAPILLDGNCTAAPSPVQVLAYALGSCMAIDVVHVLGKARTPPGALRVVLQAWRAESDPRRLTRVALRFLIEGAVPADRVEHALALSRGKYCSVWHSLRQDIELTVEYELVRT
jgi:putative redox protein